VSGVCDCAVLLYNPSRPRFPPNSHKGTSHNVAAADANRAQAQTPSSPLGVAYAGSAAQTRICWLALDLGLGQPSRSAIICHLTCGIQLKRFQPPAHIRSREIAIFSLPSANNLPVPGMELQIIGFCTVIQCCQKSGIPDRNPVDG
jgi:hypothetical protein